MKKYITEQENFWAGEFGDNYIERNIGIKQIATKINLFSRVVQCIPGGGY